MSGNDQNGRKREIWRKVRENEEKWTKTKKIDKIGQMKAKDWANWE
jgi:hypothetical protein